VRTSSTASPVTPANTPWGRVATRRLPVGVSARLALLMILGTAVVAGGLVWANTRWGVGLRGDSFAYISGARNLAAGLGYSRISGGGEIKPLTHFPPLLSIVLAGAELGGWDAVSAARGLVIALMALNTLLAGALGWQILGRPWAGAVSAVLFGLNPLFLDVHSWAMTEPLFIALTLGMLWSVGRAASAKDARRAIVPGLLAGLAFLTRYVGVAGIAAGLATFLWPTRGAHSRLRRALAFLAASLLPAGAWLVRNVWVSGTSANRLITWHPVVASRLLEACATFAGWLLPDAVVVERAWLSWFGGLVGVGCLIVAAFIVLRRPAEAPPDGSQPDLARALAWFVLAYAGVLLGNLLLLDSSTPLDARILSPLLAALVPLGAAWLVRVWSGGQLPVRSLAAVLALVLLAGFAADGRQLLDQGWLRGWGFSHRAWQNSPLLQAVRDLPPMTLYTNEPDLVYFQTGRPSYIIFGSTDPVTGLPRQGYEEWLNLAKDTLAHGGAALVLVNFERLMADPEDRAMVDALSEGLENVVTYADGVILTAGGLP
jgi:hypothetical protein